ncbi:unnamed protein product [Parascedosporium putredinis]|uniref:DNA replication licensing factor MCM7 n=1 Tax=Parascedosporium putredinis TaxID=1442378 RepID=A0A9P1H506_9PEZI|nr:unnamed protein product [Parascedosporium putredinis]CAI7997482.1 unnamed protein product [Parascedosporium putredinis]
MALRQYPAPVDYEKHQTAFELFLSEFKTTADQSIAQAFGNISIEEDDLSDDYDFLDEDEETQQRRRQERRERAERRKGPHQKYKELLQDLADRKIQEVRVDLDDLEAFENSLDENLKLVESVEVNTKHYTEVMSRAIDKLLPTPSVEINFKDDVLDVLMARRRDRNRRDAGKKALAVRHVRGEHLGHLITIRAIATRVSDVKPVVQVSAYTCDRCGCEIFQPVSERSYGPLTVCPSEDCRKNQAKGQLNPSSRASKFQPFQEVKVQELAEQVPIGQIPRSLTVLCYGTAVRQVNPGDVVDITGIFLPTPYTGFQAMKAGLLTDTYLEAHYIVQHKKAYSEMAIDPSLVRRIEQYRQSGQVYELLAKSIAPEIFGHLDVKKALLLLLIGGVTKEMGDGMKIRGDINICLMGDPGVAKSQLLKYISKVAPRGVYTSGRGSSGVGLTAAVMRDPVTDEMVLEGGALVLADNGLCCIDEFDKMDENDRTAIHEVMEQQTISISKAGISTTLNARTSILAAANPLYGRYNPRISPVENINLPAALLSRFDVMFLLLDTPTRETDAQLAKHVAYVHMHSRHPDVGADAVVFTPHEVRSYVAQARTFRPVVPTRVIYAHDPRTLLGVVRLSQALARLRFSNEVIQDDVDEALRLLEASKQSLSTEDPKRSRGLNASSKIYNIVKGLADSGACRADDAEDEDLGIELSMRKVKERVIAKGFTEDHWLKALEEYTELNIWQTAGNGTRLIFIHANDDSSDEDMSE